MNFSDEENFEEVPEEGVHVQLQRLKNRVGCGGLQAPTEVIIKFEVDLV